MIYLFGADGTGKTTHADLIDSRLRALGHKSWRAHVKHHHTFSYLLLRMFNGSQGHDPLRYYGFGVEFKGLNTPWKILEIISLAPAIIYRVFLPSLLGYTIVADRYVIDSLVALAYFLRDQDLITNRFGRLLLKLLPRDGLIIHLDASTKKILERKRDEPLTPQFLDWQLEAYRNLASRMDSSILTIDTTSAPVQTVQESIWAEFRSRKEFIEK